MTRSQLSKDPERAAQRAFALRFVLIAIAMFSIYSFPYAENGISERWFGAYLAGYARMAGALISVFEPGVTVMQNVIAGRFSLRIIKSCDAMEVNLLFCAAVLAYPTRILGKVAAVVAGLAALVAMNVARICCLYYAGLLLPSWFDLLHFDLLPLLLIAAASGLFFVWVIWIQRADRALAGSGQ